MGKITRKSFLATLKQRRKKGKQVRSEELREISLFLILSAALLHQYQ